MRKQISYGLAYAGLVAVAMTFYECIKQTDVAKTSYAGHNWAPS